jgi:hypothetical protein
MVKRLLVGVGLVTLGYLVGRAAGRWERPHRDQLTWREPTDAGVVPDQGEIDADFAEVPISRSKTDSASG